MLAFHLKKRWKDIQCLGGIHCVQGLLYKFSRLIGRILGLRRVARLFCS